MQMMRKLSESVCPDFLVLKVVSVRVVLGTMLEKRVCSFRSKGEVVKLLALNLECCPI